MPVDTSARIAVLGAGPIGLETALYARYLGYTVDLYERGAPAEHVRAWGHVRLFSPFAMNRSPLGLAAIGARNPTWTPPGDDEYLRGCDYAQRYLIPLAQTDLVADGLRIQTEVLAVGRGSLLKQEGVGDDRRAATPFRLLVRDPRGQQRTEEADVVIDATGTYGNHAWCGCGGIPAVGEPSASAAIEYGLPDVPGRDRDRYADRHTLLVGAGYSAATTVVNLAALARDAPDTRVTWVTRHPLAAAADGPVARTDGDRLAARDELARTANALAAATAGPVRHVGGVTVRAIDRDGASDKWRVFLEGLQPQTVTVDRIIANVGYRADNRLFEELHVHQCYATGGPMRLAAALSGQTSPDCLQQVAPGANVLRTTEPNFFVLGSKSYGRDSRFLISVGLAQIQQLFTIIG